ncbi:hypothetical protein BDR06DRAFT_1011603 [Suillus hirtellus]|nr:hypothetical protein BDR06DRAFT_1011603 [Suillus hirtellus]
MLLGHRMAKFLWVEAVNYAVRLKNCLPSRSIPSHTPFELAHSKYMDVSMAHEFGTPVLVHIEKASKLESHVKEARFVGVDTESKGYCMYWESRCWVSIEQNITFVPKSVVVADGVQDDGEFTPVKANINSIQATSTKDSPSAPVLAPSTPTKVPPIQVTPPAPRPARLQPPPGYYADLHNGETATLAAERQVYLEEDELEGRREEALMRWQDLALVATVAEPTLSQALSSPDTEE